MAASFRSAGTWAFTANNVPAGPTLAPGAPTGKLVGDCLVLISESRSITATVPSNPSGWNLVSGFPKRSGTASGGTFYVWTRIADGSASDAPSVVWSGLTSGTSGDATGAGILCYKGLSETLDGTVQSSDLAAQTNTSVIPAFTTGTDNSMVVGMAIKLLESSGQTSTVATFTERADNSTTSGTGHVVEASDLVVGSHGSSGTATVTWSATTSARALAVSLGLKATPPVAADAGLGALTVSGLAPTINISNQVARAGLGALTVAGLAPHVSFGTLAKAGLGALALAGLAPTLAISNKVARAGLGQVIATGLAPTARITHITTSTGNRYVTLADAFAGEVADLVAAGRALTITCHNFIDTTSAVMGAGWTTDATHNVIIEAADNHGGIFGGVGGTSAYSIDTGGSGNGLDIHASAPFTVVRGISVRGSNSGIAVRAASCLIDQCIAMAGAGSPTQGIALFSGSAGTHLQNCIAVGDDAIKFLATGLTAYNCTAISTNFTCFDAVGVSVVVVNCLGFGNGAASEAVFFAESGGTWATGCANCASDTTSVPTVGSGHRASQTFTFVNAGSGNYHLSLSDGGAKGFGANLSADGAFPFAIDIDGGSRGDVWDIGADQVAVALLPGVGSAVLAGLAPTAALSSPTAHPGVGSLVCTGFAPDIWSLPGTLRIVTVKASGGDYSTLNAAFAGEVADLVSLTRHLHIECYNFADTTQADTGTGWTTDATYNILVRAINNHGGLWGGAGGTSAYSLDASAVGSGLEINAAYTVLRGLSIKGTTDGIGIHSSHCSIEQCYAIATTRGIQVYSGATNCHVQNSIATGVRGLRFQGSGCSAYNCTGITVGSGASCFEIAAGTSLLVKNCLAYAAAGATSGGFAATSGGSWDSACANCASSDTHVPTAGSGHRTSQTFTFVNAGSGDYHLSLSDAGAKGFGANLSADGSFPFTVDIDGGSRGDVWDIGSDQVAVACLPDIGSLVLDGEPPSLTGIPTVASPGLGALTVAGLAPAVVHGTNAHAGVGALTVAGLAPRAVLDVRRYADVGTTTLTGLAPTIAVSNNQRVLAGVGVASLTGLAPSATATANQFARAGVGALSLAGLASTVAVSNNQRVLAGVGVLTLTGEAPSANTTANVRALAGLGTLSLAGFAPSITVGLTIPTGQLTLSGLAPSAAVSGNQQTLVGLGVLTITGLAPSVAIDRPVAAGVGALTLNGQAPTVTHDTRAHAGVGSLVATGLAPTAAISNNIRVLAGVGAASLTGLAPAAVATQNAFARAGLGALSLSGLAPTISTSNETQAFAGTGDLVAAGLAPSAVITANQFARPQLGTLSLSGLAPTARLNIIARPGLGSVVATGLAPRALVDTVVRAGLGTATLSGLAPRLDGAIRIGLGAAILTGEAPTVTATQNRLARAGLGQLTLTGLAPDVSSSSQTRAFAGTGLLTLTGLAPAITATANQFARAGIGTLSLAGLAPQLNSGIRAGLGSITLAGLAPRALVNVRVAAQTGTLTVAGLAPSVAVSDHQRVTPGTGSLTLTGERPLLALAITAGTGSLTCVSLAPTIRIDAFAQPDVGVVLLSGDAPTIEITHNYLARTETGSLALAGYEVQLSSSNNAYAFTATGELLIAGYRAFPVRSNDGKAGPRPTEGVLTPVVATVTIDQPVARLTLGVPVATVLIQQPIAMASIDQPIATATLTAVVATVELFD